jgi:DNA polymerase-3 subunit epsilon
VGVAIGTMGSGVYKGSVATGGGSGRAFTPIEVNLDADPSGYLYGRVVVFTGALMSMTRDMARQACAKLGATPEENTTKRTNVLVVGDINPAVLRPGSNLTGKTRRAFELQDKGQEIEVMTEDDFLRCLDGNTLDGVEVILLAGASPAAAVPARAATIRENRTVAHSEPKPVKPPRALRREPIPTEQVCSAEGCDAVAAFKTRTKPTWCSMHIEEIQLTGGLRALESFTHPDDWQLTECVACGVEAHYRFAYTLDKNQYSEPTCRACYWRSWAAEGRRMQGEWASLTPVSFEEAQAHAEAHGFNYLGPLTAPSYDGDPHRTQCRRCGKISADRLGDISFGCTCQPRG